MYLTKSEGGNMEKENRKSKEYYIQKKIRQKITILLITIIIVTLLVLTYVIPDFWLKISAFLIVIGIVLFIPFTIWLFFSKHETFWDKFF